MEAAMQIVNEEKNALSAELGRLVMELDSTKSSLEAKEGTGEASMLKAQIMEQQKMFSKDLAHIHSLAQTQKAAEQKARTKVLKLSADADRYKSKLAAQRLQTATYNKKLKSASPVTPPGSAVSLCQTQRRSSESWVSA
jgi:chromosome segregation ATPase